jgi:hypothetical protein
VCGSSVAKNKTDSRTGATAPQYATQGRSAEMTAIDGWHRYATFRLPETQTVADHYRRFIPSAEVIGEGEHSAAILDRNKAPGLVVT